ncbi:MAG: DUF4157 domain-containing protein, partial [Bryobacteraceae bacterium]|nr:DUF4157 domain-containing protein [Bryobacteraceae bacterium]
LRTGPAADRFLAANKAIAMAIDSHTIVAGSTLAALTPRRRQLVLAHELAHLLQLARPGSDPVSLIEEEAWEAAAAWISGRSYKIRGRARKPLCALAIIDRTAHPDADNWYGVSTAEPIGNRETVAVDRVRALRSITIESILDEILARPGTRDVIIVSHGTSLGLSVRLIPGSEVRGRVEAVSALSRDTATPIESEFGSGTHPALSDASAAEITMLSESRVRSLRSRMNRVRDMGLNHVAFRACNMGQSVDVLTTMKEFFGCASVSAPSLRDTYGHLDPRIEDDIPAWRRTQESHGWHVHVENFGPTIYAIPNPTAIATRGGDGHDTTYSTRFAAQSREAVRSWVGFHLRDGYDRGNIYYHGMFVSAPEDGRPRVLFIRDHDFLSRLVRV